MARDRSRLRRSASRSPNAASSPYERDDGLHPYGPFDPNPRYDDYLREHGFGGPNPWEDWANSAEGDDGELLSGWLLRYNNLAARVPGRAFGDALHDLAGDGLHGRGRRHSRGCAICLSSSRTGPISCRRPITTCTGPSDILPPVRSEAERQTDHPVFRAYQNTRICRAFSRDGVRERVMPAYMGLIKQIDDQMGRLFAWMKERGLFDNTMIVFSSDHGDYLGDHWMGEKDLFHDAVGAGPADHL